MCGEKGCVERRDVWRGGMGEEVHYMTEYLTLSEWR